MPLQASNKADLQVHLDGRHRGDVTPKACSKCDFRANNANLLDLHVRTKHEEDRLEDTIEAALYKCTLCSSFTANNESMVDLHLRVVHKKPQAVS